MPERPVVAIVFGSCIFLTIGLLTGQFGAVLAELSGRTGTTLAEVGALFTALFLGGLVTQSSMGALSDRVGNRPVLLLGLALAALGAAGIGLSRSLPVLLACAAVTGLGYGSLTFGTNLLVAQAYARRSVSALNLVNLFFSFGAVLGPALAGLALHNWGTGLPVLWLGTALLVMLIPAAFSLRPGKPPVDLLAAAGEAGATVYHSPFLWAMSGLLLLYVGLEVAMGGWTPTYLQATTGLRLEMAALGVSAYYLALTAGRLVNSWLGLRFSAHQVLLTSLAGALAGGLLLALSTGQLAWSVAGVLILGFSFGAIFPTAYSMITGAFLANAGKAASVAQASGSLGGMCLPWLLGLLLVHSGPGASMNLIAAGTLGMLVLYLAARRLAGRMSQPAASPLPPVAVQDGEDHCRAPGTPM